MHVTTAHNKHDKVQLKRKQSLSEAFLQTAAI